MKLLLLSPYPPYPPRSGGMIRIYHLLKGLARHHEVWVLTFAPDEAAAAAMEPLRDDCHLITVAGPPSRSLIRRGWTTLASPLPDMALRNSSPAYTAALHQLLADQTFDLIQAESIEMAGYALQARPAQQENPLLVLDEFNAEYMLQKGVARIQYAALKHHLTPARALRWLYALIQGAKLAAYERRLLRTFDRIVAVSEEDRAALQRLYPAAPIGIVPNGVDTDYFVSSSSVVLPADMPPSPFVVFTGSLDFLPNIDAVTWFVGEVLPLVHEHHPDVRFVVLGRSPSPAVLKLQDHRAIEIVGEVDDVRPYIAASSGYVIPMRMGGGVRLKLLEALAMEVPVVCTSMGAEGVPHIRSGEHLLIADTPQAFALALLSLLSDPPHAQQMGRDGRSIVREHYDWKVITPRLEAVYTRVVRQPA